MDYLDLRSNWDVMLALLMVGFYPFSDFFGLQVRGLFYFFAVGFFGYSFLIFLAEWFFHGFLATLDSVGLSVFRGLTFFAGLLLGAAALKTFLIIFAWNAGSVAFALLVLFFTAVFSTFTIGTRALRHSTNSISA
ncbi:MAG: hypothetical protein ACE5DI_06280 [Candidatus Micrarchaeia archaeon]